MTLIELQKAITLSKKYKTFPTKNTFGFKPTLSMDKYKLLESKVFICEYYYWKLASINPVSEDENKLRLSLRNNIEDVLLNLYNALSEPGKSDKSLPSFFEVPQDEETYINAHAKQANYLLIEAAKGGDVELLDVALKSGGDVNFTHIGETSLHIAVEKKRYDIVRRLSQEKYIDINFQKQMGGDTALMLAISYCSDAKMAKILLDARADFDICNYRNETPLSVAVKQFEGISLECVKVLLDQPTIDVNKPPTSNTTLVQEAIRVGNRNIVQLLLTKNPSKNKNDLRVAIEKKDAFFTELLLINNYPATSKLLAKACSSGFWAGVELLINHGADGDLAKQILQSTKGYTPLLCAIALRDSVAVTQLLKAGHDINQPSTGYTVTTPLLFAAKYGYQDMLAILIENNADLTQKTDRAETALMLAASGGHNDCVKSLITASCADINDEDDSGQTALMMAAESGDDETVKILMQVGTIDINKQNQYIRRDTALMIATRERKVATVKLLLSRKDIELDTVNRHDETAITLANQSQNLEIIKAFKIKLTAPFIDALILKVTGEIERLQGTNKAKEMQAALDRAQQDESARVSLDDFLNYKAENQISLSKALSAHRRGFFGKTTTEEHIEQFRAKETPKIAQRLSLL